MVRNSKGITLITLAITIIVLLILAGVSLSLVIGNEGILEKAVEANQKTEIAAGKEMIELEVGNLVMNGIINRQDLDEETWQKLEQKEELEVIDVAEFPIEILYKSKYIYEIDEQYKVSYVGEVDDTIVRCKVTPQGYTNEKVTATVKVNSPKGIRSIQFGTGEVEEVTGSTIKKEYEINTNGEYRVKVIDGAGTEITKLVVVDKIDKEAPKEFTIEAQEVLITTAKFDLKVEDKEATNGSIQSGIERYEYYINDEKYDESDKAEHVISNLTTDTDYNIYVIVYDKAGNSRRSSNTLSIHTKLEGYPILTANGWKIPENFASDALGREAYDGDLSTCVNVSSGKTKFYIAENAFIHKIGMDVGSNTGTLIGWGTGGSVKTGEVWAGYTVSKKSSNYWFFTKEYFGNQTGSQVYLLNTIGMDTYEIIYDETKQD